MHQRANGVSNEPSDRSTAAFRRLLLYSSFGGGTRTWVEDAGLEGARDEAGDEVALRAPAQVAGLVVRRHRRRRVHQPAAAAAAAARRILTAVASTAAAAGRARAGGGCGRGARAQCAVGAGRRRGAVPSQPA